MKQKRSYGRILLLLKAATAFVLVIQTKVGWTADPSFLGLSDPGSEKIAVPREPTMTGSSANAQSPTTYRSVLQVGKALIRTIQGPAVYSDGPCEAPRRIGLYNSVGAIIFSSQHIAFLPSELVDPTATRTAEFSRTELTNPCKALPAMHYSMFGEAIALFSVMDEIGVKCMTLSQDKCAESVFSFADVSADGELSVAEVARVFRALAFFVSIGLTKELSQNETLIKEGSAPSSNVYIASAILAMVGPSFANNFIASVDFDANGTASLAEIMQDRHGTLAGATGALANISVETTLKSFSGVVTAIFGQMGGLLR